jgi:hypothetical protein
MAPIVHVVTEYRNADELRLMAAAIGWPLTNAEILKALRG